MLWEIDQSVPLNTVRVFWRTGVRYCAFLKRVRIFVTSKPGKLIAFAYKFIDEIKWA